jgi:membrane dipeptidase
MLAGGVGPLGSTAAARTAETASTALDVLRKFISVDVHSHGGKTGITSKAPPNDDLANDMRAGSLAVACLADVPDGPILARDAEGYGAAGVSIGPSCLPSGVLIVAMVAQRGRLFPAWLDYPSDGRTPIPTHQVS